MIGAGILAKPRHDAATGEGRAATLADGYPTRHVCDDRHFVVDAFAMTAEIVAGFPVQLAAGRSSFASPALVHAHAIVFMGWVGL